ncbi:MAG TPA: amidohydrolase [Thermoanaerobaculia bacterium]|nr:amidohydrolase [Thermoanaerobaculia bacterium]HEV8609178.1 amidohydrolase [Thermoanaerobaculia bacterium]
MRRIVLLAAFLVLAAAPARREPADLLITGGMVATVDASFTVFSPGAVAIRGEEILAVGPAAEIAAKYAARERYDASGKIVLPGLVNTHTHAAMTLLRGIADDLPLDRWLTEHIFPAEGKNVSPGFVYDGTLLAALEMIEGGTTAFADMYYFESDAARAVDRAGLRAVLGETFIDFPVPDHKDLKETLAFMEVFAKKWKGHPRITPAAAPHSGYTCSKETLLAARDFAQSKGLPLLTHVAESPKELADAREKWGKTPVAYLASIGFFDPPASGNRLPIVGAHAIWMDAADRALVKQYGVGISHNPESNMKLASGIADVAAWEREGLLWGLGTDGPAGSNNDLSMFEAMDFAGKLAKVSTGDPTVLPAREIVAAATREGARVLGLGEKTGSLERGKRADVIALDARTAHEQPFDDVYSTLVYSAKTADVTDVWVDGKRLLANRRCTTIDRAAVLAAAAKWRAKVRESLAAPAKETPKP